MGLNGGLIYAPAALLALGGDGHISHTPLIVNQLQISGNGVNALATDGGNTTTDAAGQLLAGDLQVYVDNASGSFNNDELARIADAITSVNTTLIPYSISVSEVYESDSANVVLTFADSTDAGGHDEGVLGAEAPGSITLVQGWDFYAGADPATVGAGQYDFETIVVHELGHSLGLGHNSDSRSAMFATLDTGTAKRSLVTKDLNIPDVDLGPDALHVSRPAVVESASRVETNAVFSVGTAISAPTSLGIVTPPRANGFPSGVDLLSLLASVRSATIPGGDLAPPLLAPMPGSEPAFGATGLGTGGGVRAPVVGESGPSCSGWSAGSDWNAASLLCVPLLMWEDLAPADPTPGGPDEDPSQQGGDGWLWDEFPIPLVQPGRGTEPSHDESALRHDSSDRNPATTDGERDVPGAFWAAPEGSQDLAPVTVAPAPASETLDLFFGHLGLCDGDVSNPWAGADEGSCDK